MTNYYLKGFKLGFQPNRHTAEKVYHEIVKRKPDFLEKQVPASLSKSQIQNLGQFEGDFLTNEIEVDRHNITFSNLAQELLFTDKAALELDPEQQVLVESEVVTDNTRQTTVKDNSLVKATQSKEDELSW